VFSHAKPSYGRFTRKPRKYRSGWLPPALLFITTRYRYPSAFPTLPAKTAAIPAYPHRNPIDRPASTPPAAHFKRLYRNFPQKGIPPETSSRGSHDRVLTLLTQVEWIHSHA
jgi:hypothetical protein